MDYSGQVLLHFYVVSVPIMLYSILATVREHGEELLAGAGGVANCHEKI